MAARQFEPASIAIVLLLAACAALAFFLAQSTSEAASLKKGNAALQAQLATLQANHSWLEGKNRQAESMLLQSQEDLEGKSAQLASAQADIASLSSQLSSAKRDLSQSKADLDAQRSKAAQILESLNTLEGEINESIAWFTTNSALPENGGWATEVFGQRAATDCVDSGKLNLACIAYLMENTAFSIHYRTDSPDSDGSDHLQSVAETIRLGWGDCEDYSLIFKATLNSLKGSVPDAKATAFAGGGGDFRVYPKESAPLTQGDSYWHVPNAHGVPLGTLSELHPYVVCFTQDAYGGHCMVALTEADVSSSKGIPQLDGARVFEPQSGLYHGTIGTDFGICGSDDCYFEPFVIRLVIADSGLYFFQRGGTGWVGYEDYLAEVAKAKQSLS
jgi:predicted transglutaminase-like cysteine proteinase